MCVFDRHVTRIETCTRNPAYVEQCLAIIAQAFMRRFAGLLSGDLSPMVFVLASIGGE